MSSLNLRDELLESTSGETIVRASSLPEYPDCARRWAAQHMRKEIEGATGAKLGNLVKHIGGITGTATHVGMAVMLGEKMTSGVLAPIGETEDAAMEALREDLRGGVLWDEISPHAATAEHQVRRQIRTYRVHVADKVNPSAVEKRLWATDEKTGIVVTGRTDLIVVAPDTLKDLKTGARGPGSNWAQYGLYSRLGRSHGHKIDAIEEDFVPRVRPDREQPRPITIPYDVITSEAVTEETLGRIARDVTEFRQTGEPQAFLANPQSQLCSPRFCPAHGTAWCRVGKPERK